MLTFVLFSSTGAPATAPPATAPTPEAAPDEDAPLAVSLIDSSDASSDDDGVLPGDAQRTTTVYFQAALLLRDCGAMHVACDCILVIGMFADASIAVAATHWLPRGLARGDLCEASLLHKVMHPRTAAQLGEACVVCHFALVSESVAASGTFDDTGRLFVARARALGVLDAVAADSGAEPRRGIVGTYLFNAERTAEAPKGIEVAEAHWWQSCARTAL
ncbi:hypothetical protein M885DRAFT_569057 [Pelagophyceae sp. CCMP2097]|nr:hypothetical protein M885DRAFT_569057 [Pelagophyceae sp. CCMP2097]